MLKLDLPWPPTINSYWRSLVVKKKTAALDARFGFNTHKSLVVLSKAGRDYRETAVAMIRTAMWDVRTVFSQWPMKGDVSVTLDFHPPDKRSRDLDNLPKAVFDSFTYAGVWADDDQVAHFSATRREQIEGGGVTITVKPMVWD